MKREERKRAVARITCTWQQVYTACPRSLVWPLFSEGLMEDILREKHRIYQMLYAPQREKHRHVNQKIDIIISMKCFNIERQGFYGASRLNIEDYFKTRSLRSVFNDKLHVYAICPPQMRKGYVILRSPSHAVASLVLIFSGWRKYRKSCKKCSIKVPRAKGPALLSSSGNRWCLWTYFWIGETYRLTVLFPDAILRRRNEREGRVSEV